MTVDDLISDVLKKEGCVYTCIPGDAGGPTKYGITQKTLSVVLHHPATVEDVKGIAEEQARVIYKNLYFYAPRLQELPEEIQPCVFDMGVNSGVGAAIEALQEVLNMAGFPCSVDGLVGPKTTDIAKQAQGAMGPFLVNSLVDYRVWFYNKLAENKPSNRKFLKGWLNRAESFRVPV